MAEKDAGWLEGYESSTCESANSPLYPGNQVWAGVGKHATDWKAHWKNKPTVLPWGSNDEGGK